MKSHVQSLTLRCTLSTKLFICCPTTVGEKRATVAARALAPFRVANSGCSNTVLINPDKCFASGCAEPSLTAATLIRNAVCSSAYLPGAITQSLVAKASIRWSTYDGYNQHTLASYSQHKSGPIKAVACKCHLHDLLRDAAVAGHNCG